MTSSVQAAGSFTPRSSQSNAPPLASKTRTRLYKEYLTPALHRRFTSAAALVLVLCWVEASLLSGTNHIFWSWFPIGLTGLRTLLMFIPCLAIFIVRVANIHIGKRTAVSFAQGLYDHVATTKSLVNLLHTFAWYVFSGWFFGEVYIWSRTEEAMLRWIDPGEDYERPRLNENPIALRSLFVLLAVAQAVVHLARDYDRVDIHAGVELATSQQSSNGEINGGNDSSKLPQPFPQLATQIVPLQRRVLQLVVGVLFVAFPPVYWGLVRRSAWSTAYNFGRIFYSELPPSAAPTGLVNVGGFFWQALSSSYLLVTIWEVSNVVFGLFVTLPPIRKGEALTSQVKDAQGVIIHASKDPNGSLITGLKSKKEVPKTFAFWELSLICNDYPQRRKTIYQEVDREGNSTWTQICVASLAEIVSINTRINASRSPAPRPAQSQTAGLPASEPPGLPKIADQAVKTDPNIVAKRKPDLSQQIGNLTRSIGQSPGQQQPILPKAQEAIQWTADRVLSKQDQERYSRAHLQQGASTYALDVLKTPIGEPFRQTFAQTVNATVFGTPVSAKANIIHAAQALSRLAVSSLREDDFGQVSKDVPRIVRTFTDAITSIEAYTQSLKPHWTDVAFNESHRIVPDIHETLQVLKGGLEEMMLAFGEYAANMGLSKKEVREAREAAGSIRAAGEMSQVKR